MDGSALPNPSGGFADPEAVLSTVEDASMSGDNSTATGRRRFAAAVISLTMTAVGSVVLSLPQVFAECGAVGGVAALAGFAALTDASLVIIARAARAVDARTYEQTVTRVVGPTGGKTLRVCLCVLLFGTLASLQIIAADLAAPVVESLVYRDSETGGFWSSRVAIHTGVLALVYPLSLLENLSRLAAASSAAFFVMIGVGLVLVARFAEAGFPVAADVVLVGTRARSRAPCRYAPWRTPATSTSWRSRVRCGGRRDRRRARRRARPSTLPTLPPRARTRSSSASRRNLRRWDERHTRTRR